MPAPVNINFMPEIKCPHCGNSQHASLSGWGRSGLNVRFKYCRKCEKEFSVVIYVETCTPEELPNDGSIRSLKDSIKYQKEHRKKRQEQLILELQIEKSKTSGEWN